MSGAGFKPTPPLGDQKSYLSARINLESGSLDHLAILTGHAGVTKSLNIIFAFTTL